MNLIKTFRNGVIDENPALRMILGLCPLLAVTTSAINGIGMGAATLAVLTGSNIVVSLLRKAIPPKVRIPVFVTVIAGFVTIVQMLMKAYVPALDKALGIFIPLIVVNCVILARSEIFASKNTVLTSIVDGIGMGLGYTLALLLMGSVREILGNGTIFGLSLFGDSASPALAMILPPGGFLALGVIIAVINKISGVKVQSTGCVGCSALCKKALPRKGDV